MALKAKKPEYEAEDQADVVQHFRDLAETERAQAAVKRLTVGEKTKHETRAEAFDECAAILDSTTVSEW